MTERHPTPTKETGVTENDSRGHIDDAHKARGVYGSPVIREYSPPLPESGSPFLKYLPFTPPQEPVIFIEHEIDPRIDRFGRLPIWYFKIAYLKWHDPSVVESIRDHVSVHGYYNMRRYKQIGDNSVSDLIFKSDILFSGDSRIHGYADPLSIYKIKQLAKEKHNEKIVELRSQHEKELYDFIESCLYGGLLGGFGSLIEWSIDRLLYQIVFNFSNDKFIHIERILRTSPNASKKYLDWLKKEFRSAKDCMVLLRNNTQLREFFQLPTTIKDDDCRVHCMKTYKMIEVTRIYFSSLNKVNRISTSKEDEELNQIEYDCTEKEKEIENDRIKNEKEPIRGLKYSDVGGTEKRNETDPFRILNEGLLCF